MFSFCGVNLDSVKYRFLGRCLCLVVQLKISIVLHSGIYGNYLVYVLKGMHHYRDESY